MSVIVEVSVWTVLFQFRVFLQIICVIESDCNSYQTSWQQGYEHVHQLFAVLFEYIYSTGSFGMQSTIGVFD